jgi:hypothetical protein
MGDSLIINFHYYITLFGIGVGIMFSNSSDITKARISAGLTISEVSKANDIPEDILEWYEKNPWEIPVSVAKKLSSTYSVSIDSIEF